MSRFLRWIAGLSGFTLLVMSLMLVWSRRHEPQPLVAFLSNRDGNSEVYLMTPGGQMEQQLTFTDSTMANGQGHCWFDWAVDGQFIYKLYGSSYEPGDFYCYHGYGELSQINIHGQQIRELMTWESPDDFSPDGEWALLTRDVQTTNQRYLSLIRVHIRTDYEEELFQFEGFDWIAPKWSDDGKWITFFDRDNGTHQYQIYRLDSDSKEIQTIALDSKLSYCPPYPLPSPDSQWIMFTSGEDCNQMYLASLNTQKFGSQEKLLVELESRPMDYTPFKWSPDGKWIAYITLLPELRVISTDTGLITRVIQIPYHERMSFDWSPDSQWLIFSSASQPAGEADIHRIKIDGTGLEMLTNSTGNNIMPKHSPPIDFPLQNEIIMGIGLLLLILGYAPFLKWHKKIA